METRLNHLEFEIVNAILPLIKPELSFFNVPSLYCTILKEKFPTTVNGVRTGLYDKARDEHVNNFKNVTNFLIEQDFAVKVLPPSSIYVDLKLTPRGEVLWAYGEHGAFYRSLNKSHEKEIRQRVEDIIGLAFNYGEFAIEQSAVKNMVISIDLTKKSVEQVRVEIDELLSRKKEIIRTHEFAKIDEEAVGYLVQEGFAVNRHDITGGRAKVYRQLTDRGRKLKELGTITAFNEWDKKEKEQERIKTVTEREFIQKQNEFIDINTAFAKKQDDAIESQIQTNELAKITNIYIAVFTGLGGLYALLQLLITLIPDHTPKRTLIINLIMAFALLVGIVGYRRIDLINRQSKKQKQP